MTTNTPASQLKDSKTGSTWRMGNTLTDRDPKLMPAATDRKLHEVGRMTNHGQTFVIVQHETTGLYYARNTRTARLCRAYKVF